MNIYQYITTKSINNDRTSSYNSCKNKLPLIHRLNTLMIEGYKKTLSNNNNNNNNNNVYGTYLHYGNLIEIDRNKVHKHFKNLSGKVDAFTFKDLGSSLKIIKTGIITNLVSAIQLTLNILNDVDNVAGILFKVKDKISIVDTNTTVFNLTNYIDMLKILKDMQLYKDVEGLIIVYTFKNSPKYNTYDYSETIKLLKDIKLNCNFNSSINIETNSNTINFQSTLSLEEYLHRGYSSIKGLKPLNKLSKITFKKDILVPTPIISKGIFFPYYNLTLIYGDAIDHKSLTSLHHGNCNINNANICLGKLTESIYNHSLYGVLNHCNMSSPWSDRLAESFEDYIVNALANIELTKELYESLFNKTKIEKQEIKKITYDEDTVKKYLGENNENNRERKSEPIWTINSTESNTSKDTPF